MQVASNVIPLQTPARTFLVQFVARHGMFRPFLELLPSTMRVPHRARCERLLGLLLRGTIHEPRLTEDEVRALIMHGKTPRKIMYRELAFMRRHPEWRTVLERWCVPWQYARSDEERQFIRYATAMLARIYRLEYAVRLRGLLAATNE